MNAITKFEPQAELFIKAKSDERTVSAISQTLCSGIGDANHASAVLLAEALVGFVASYGEKHELNFQTIGRLLSMSNEQTDESALDLMFKQVIEGVYNQKKHHQELVNGDSMKWVGQWVKNPDRKPEPDNPACVKYRAFKERPESIRVGAVWELRLANDRLADYPGHSEIAAALLVFLGDCVDDVV